MNKRENFAYIWLKGRSSWDWDPSCRR